MYGMYNVWYECMCEYDVSMNDQNICMKIYNPDPISKAATPTPMDSK